MKTISGKLFRMPNQRKTLYSVDSKIFFIRNRRVIVDADLAEIYGVTAKRLNEQVKRNHERFPSDFMFRLTQAEYKVLRSQIATSKRGRGGRQYLPHAFTEHGAIMAATVLNSTRSVQMSVYVVRAFVRLREMLATNRRLAVKIAELENRMDSHDDTIQEVFDAIKELMTPPEPRPGRIGFQLPPRRRSG